jgi:uncharacterized protein (DUF4415 family)
MKTNLVKRSIDLAALPPLSVKQKSELAKLAARSEDQIDYSDIPPLQDAFWSDAVRGRFYKPTKASTTVRIDADVLAWLKGHGKGYQTRMNAILRKEMLSVLTNGPHAKPDVMRPQVTQQPSKRRTSQAR